MSYRGFYNMWGWWESDPHELSPIVPKTIASNQFRHIPRIVDPGGLEPPLSEPESDVLATTLWVNKKKQIPYDTALISRFNLECGLKQRHLIQGNSTQTHLPFNHSVAHGSYCLTIDICFVAQVGFEPTVAKFYARGF